MAKHLNLEDRITIQTGLKEGKNITEIADILSRNKSTISREIISKRYFLDFRRVSSIQSKNACIHRYTCKIKDNCKSPECFKRNKNCRLCGMCIGYCSSFEEETCTKYAESPYVCNGCTKKPRCTLSKWLYDANKAQNSYKNTLSEARQGISLNETELENLNNIVSPLLKKGQSVRNICFHQADSIMLSDKSIYNYIHKRLLSADCFDLQRTVQRKVFRKPGPPVLIDKSCRKNRTYDDFKSFINDHPDTAVVEMDTIEGIKGGKVILSLFFRTCEVQLYFLRDRNTSASVTAIFEQLRNILTNDEFKILFPVIITDRGSEFSNPIGIENNSNGESLTKVFYCDPQNTNQKSRCERNHEFVRFILPKGSSFDRFEQDDILLMANHINSYGREKLNNRAPIELFEILYGAQIVQKLGFKRIPPIDIVLRNELLK